MADVEHVQEPLPTIPSPSPPTHDRARPSQVEEAPKITLLPPPTVREASPPGNLYPQSGGKFHEATDVDGAPVRSRRQEDHSYVPEEEEEEEKGKEEVHVGFRKKASRKWTEWRRKVWLKKREAKLAMAVA